MSGSSRSRRIQTFCALCVARCGAVGVVEAGRLSRPMRDQRALARYAGLTGSPDESGAKRREQGLARAGNARVRRGMVQLAWRLSAVSEGQRAGIVVLRPHSR